MQLVVRRDSQTVLGISDCLDSIWVVLLHQGVFLTLDLVPEGEWLVQDFDHAHIPILVRLVDTLRHPSEPAVGSRILT